MDLRTSDGAYSGLTEAQLARLLESSPPLVVLDIPGGTLVALQGSGAAFALLHWDGRCWRQTRPLIEENELRERLLASARRYPKWGAGLSWEPLSGCREGERAILPGIGLHVALTYTLSFGGFAIGACGGFWLADTALPDNVVWAAYLFAAMLAPPLAIAGQRAARALHAACARCGGAALPLQAGRFAYLCPECGHVNITRWGLHRGPMSP